MALPRICMITSVHKHDDIRIYHKEAKALKKAGYDVTVLCQDYQGNDESGVHFCRITLPPSRVKRIAQAWQLMAQKAMELNCQIYHIHDPELLPAAFWLKDRGKTVVYDAHEDTPRQLLAKPYWNFMVRKTASKAVEWMENRAGSRLDKVFAATSSIAKRYKNGVPIENFPQLEEFPPDLLTPYEKRPCQVCYVGAITENRGLTAMVQSVQNVPVRLSLAGALEFPSLAQKIKQLDKEEKVQYKGVLNRAETVQLIGGSRAGLLLLKPTPSYIQSYPIKLFEYLLAATPVILSDFLLWREIVGKENGIFVPPEDTAKIKAALEYLLAHPQEGKQMGLAGQKRVKERFLFPEKRLLCQYQELWKGGAL